MYTNSGIFFNLKCDSEISTEIDILITLQRFSLNVFINVFWFIEYYSFNNYALLCLLTNEEFLVLMPNKNR